MIISSRVQLRDAAYRNRHVRQGIPGEVLNPPGDSTNTLRLEACLQEYVTSKPAAVVRATIETESDVFVMPSLLLVGCERRRCYVTRGAKRIHKLNTTLSAALAPGSLNTTDGR